jgi:hydroxymethylglutaryl-CoA reductase
MDSLLPGFYRLSLAERRALLAARGVPTDVLRSLGGDPGLGFEGANRMVENALGVLELPLGVCANLLVDGRDRLAPMAVEEPSVIAAASHAARLLRAGGGVTTQVTPPLMIGQVQLLDVPDLDGAARALLAARPALLARADAVDPPLVAAGGGARELAVRHLPPVEADDPVGPLLVVHLLVDVRDAMGANAVNTMCEALAPALERLTGGRARLRILSNLADRRTVVAEGRVPLTTLGAAGAAGGAAGGADVARGIVEASVFAERDPYRAATHNKGILNGVDAVLVALGQDWRAVEAGAHAFAARDGRYTALARWRVRGEALHGRLELPMAVGVVGGVVRVHPTVQAALRLAEVTSAAELSALAAAVGLAQNLGALRALAAEGIQRGHMRLHARNVAAEVGARGDEVERVAQRLADGGRVSRDAAAAVLAELRRGTR